jgi:iron complex transport system substrate-binding protein
MRIAPRFVVLVVVTFGLVSAAFADPGFPVTLQDATGAWLTLTSAPKAIVSLTLTTDEILVDLVDPGRLRAIEAFAADPGISNIAAFAQGFPTKITAEKERLIALQPDLVFVADWKEKEFVQALRDAKIPVFVFHSPDNFDQLKQAIHQVATLVGEQAQGKAQWARVEARLAAVAAKVKAVPGKRPTILSYSFWGSTYAKGTSFDALVEKAGLVNAATQAGLSGWPQLSKEQVLALDPDVIALPSWSSDGKDDPVKFREAFVNDPVFAGLQAVKNHRVVVLPDRHLQSTSPFMADGVEDLARVGYPTLFP